MSKPTVPGPASAPGTVSVVIPIHNAAAFIDQTLNAVLKTPVQGLELVLVFDNCTDDSMVRARECLERHHFKNAQLITSRNGSTAKSRNEGISLAQGDFVAFVDHDDLVDSTMYDRLQEYVSTSPVDVVRCGFSILHEDKPEEIVERLPDRESYPFRGIFVWNGMFRRQFLNANGIRFHPGYGEDYEFNLALLAHGATEGRIEEKSAYYHWRHHGTNLHKTRKAGEFMARIESILTHHGGFLEKDRVVMAHLVSWVAEYIVYLTKGLHRDDIACAYVASTAVRNLMTRSRLEKISNASVRTLLRSKSVEEFQVQVDRMQEPARAVRRSAVLRLAHRVILGWRRQKTRVTNVYRNTGGLGPFLSFAIRRVIRPPFQISFQTPARSALIRNRLAFLDAHKGPKAIFYVFRQEYISGGLISIYSIAAKLRENGIEPVLVGDPGVGHVPRNTLFPNEEVSIPWGEFRARHWPDVRYVMVPEVKLTEFAALAGAHDLRFPGATMNILNQNNSLMPERSVVDQARPRFAEITMTTAHVRYSSQETADTFQVPVKHLSTYLSHTDYRRTPFDEKRDLILYSVDSQPMKGRIMQAVQEAFPRLHHQVVMGLTYKDYLETMDGAKFSISFGEGLDNYFIEPFFCGAIGFSVYHPEFMPSQFLEFENVFSSYSEMERSLPRLMRRLIEDPDLREAIWRKNFDVLSALYDGETHDRKLREWLAGDCDFLPAGASQPM